MLRPYFFSKVWEKYADKADMKRPGRITEYNRKERGRELNTKETCPLLKGFAEKCPYLFSDDVDMPRQIALFCLNKKHKDCPAFIESQKL